MSLQRIACCGLGVEGWAGGTASTAPTIPALLRRLPPTRSFLPCRLLQPPSCPAQVCTSELGAAAKLQEKFKKRGVQLVALSCNDLESHMQASGGAPSSRTTAAGVARAGHVCGSTSGMQLRRRQRPGVRSCHAVCAPCPLPARLHSG